MGQLGQAPEPAQNASFLHKDSVLKIVSSGTVSTGAVLPGDNSSVHVPHTLGYSPMVIAYITAPGGFKVPLPAFLNLGSASGGSIQFQSFTDVTSYSNEVVFFSANASTISTYGPWTIKYYLLENEADNL